MLDLTRASTLAELPTAAKRLYGDSLLAVDDSSAITYEGLDLASARFAASLRDAGVRPGDRVALWMTNRVEWLIAQFGVFRAGAVLVPVNPQFKAEELAHILEDSDSSVLIYEGSFLGRYDARTTLLQARGLREKPLVTGGVICLGERDAGELSFADFESRQTAVPLSGRIDSSDICQINYTSGTTGAPKGGQLTSLGLLTTYRNVARNLSLTAASSAWLLSLPLSTMFGCDAVLLPAMLSGARIVLRPRFDAADACSVIRAEGITHVAGSPAMHQMMLANGLSRASSRLHAGIIAGAVASEELMRALIVDGPLPDLVNMFGQTEGCGTATMTTTADPLEKRLTTVGRPLDHVELRIAALDGSGWCPPGDPGEICGRGRFAGVHTFAGYCGQSERTRLSPDDWLHYGDIGSLDEEGYLSVERGRLKDMYVSGGYNVYPPEVERILKRHPAIEMIAVVGVPDERLGEVGAAFVKTVPGATVTSEQLIAWCRDNLSHYKVPTHVRFVSELPTTSSGKVRRGPLLVAFAREGERP